MLLPVGGLTRWWQQGGVPPRVIPPRQRMHKVNLPLLTEQLPVAWHSSILSQAGV